MTKPELVFAPHSQEYFDNPYEIYPRMRDETPIYYDEEHDFYALIRHEDVTAPRRRTRAWATAYTVASVPRWPGWRPASRSSICSISCRGMRSTSTVSKACTCRTLPATRMCQ